MTETYSLAAVGRLADSPFTVTPLKIGDSAGLAGSQSLAMQNNTQILCKDVSGRQGFYTIDAERSIPGVSVVLKAVGP